MKGGVFQAATQTIYRAPDWTHRWHGRRYLPERYGELCRIVTAYKGKFAVEFQDGERVITMRGTVRKVVKC